MKNHLLTALLLLIAGTAGAQDIKVVAHRGAWNCPEAGYARNSAAALRQSIAKNYYGSEFDVNMCADGSLVVFHDGKAEGMKFEEHTPEDFKHIRLENGEPIPGIDEYLAEAAGAQGLMLVFELKTHSSPELETKAVKESIESLKRAGLYDPQRVMFISFSFHICKEFVRLAPGFKVQYLGFTKNLRQVSEAGLDGIDFNHRLLNKARVRKAHKLGLTVNCWTVNDEKTASRMIRIGVDQITTDYPEMVRSLIEKYN